MLYCPLMGAEKEERIWTIVAIGFYLVAFGVCAAIIGGHITRLASFTFFDLTVVSLATFRLVHLLTYDKIFDFVREAFMDKRDGELHKPKRGLRRIACELLECLWCTGMWSGLIALTLYLWGIWGAFIVFVFAVAGVGSLLQLISKAIARSEEK